MPVYMTARYQVPKTSVESCKQAISTLVDPIKREKPRTKLYLALQEIQNPMQFVHFMLFENEAAMAIHRNSHAAESFVNFLYPKTITPVEFTEHNLIASSVGEL